MEQNKKHAETYNYFIEAHPEGLSPKPIIRSQDDLMEVAILLQYLEIEYSILPVTEVE